MKSILATGLLLCLAGSALHGRGQAQGRADMVAPQRVDGNKANSTSGQIEVKTNRFNNVITVTLKPQTILNKPETQITMGIEAKLGEKGQVIDTGLLLAHIRFEMQVKSLLFPGGAEINLLVNDRPVSAGEADFQVDGLAEFEGKIKPGYRFRQYSNGGAFGRDELEALSNATQIQMQLGSIEMTLSKTVVATLREYASQVLELSDKISPKKNAPRILTQVKTPGPSQSTNDAQAADASQVEVKFWESIENSNDPKDFEAYIRKYPNGHFIDLANNRIKSLGDSNGASAPANGAPERPTDDSSNKDGQSQTLKFKLGHQHGGAFSSSYHEGVLSIAPQKIQWEEVGLMSDRDDNFSVSCSDVVGIHVNLREGEPKPDTTVADHEYVRLELKDSALNRKGRKRYSFPVIDISDTETVKAAGEAI
ncbi:MAG TPA: hypothetical protein VFV58_08070, partial [Blastocatellia bacterium]|nr:hypothetical protein [Blastocatellia bacterium]